jgi:hypothetical protein
MVQTVVLAAAQAIKEQGLTLHRAPEQVSKDFQVELV